MNAVPTTIRCGVVAKIPPTTPPRRSKSHVAIIATENPDTIGKINVRKMFSNMNDAHLISHIDHQQTRRNNADLTLKLKRTVTN